MTARGESIVLGGLDVVRVRALGAPRPASLLFVHGMWGGAWVWERWLPFFAARGWDGYALNLRGRAGSRPVADIGRVPLTDYIEDAASVARRLGAVVVVGHSMGGLVAQALAATLTPVAAVAVTPAAPRGIWPLRSAELVAATLRYAPALIRSRPLLPSRRVMTRLALGRLPPEERDSVYARLVPESARQARDIASRSTPRPCAAPCSSSPPGGTGPRRPSSCAAWRSATAPLSTSTPGSATCCRWSRAGRASPRRTPMPSATFALRGGVR